MTGYGLLVRRAQCPVTYMATDRSPNNNINLIVSTPEIESKCASIPTQLCQPKAGTRDLYTCSSYC